jgi:demethylmenaquinone methyltransferase/2-methoxy-6-polyprenyl-1,4-benzoquinol methylase
MVRVGYRFYLHRVMPILARLVSSDAPAYRYLTESIEAWPNQPRLATWLQDAGFTQVMYRNLTGGIVALHRGVKPVNK